MKSKRFFSIFINIFSYLGKTIRRRNLILPQRLPSASFPRELGLAIVFCSLFRKMFYRFYQKKVIVVKRDVFFILLKLPRFLDKTPYDKRPSAISVHPFANFLKNKPQSSLD